MRTILAVAAALLLAACAATPEEIAAADQATCASYGYPVGHARYGECRFALDQMRFQAAQAQANNAFAAAAQLGAMQQRYQPVAPAYAPAPPITCSRNGTLGYTCY